MPFILLSCQRNDREASFGWLGQLSLTFHYLSFEISHWYWIPDWPTLFTEDWGISTHDSVSNSTSQMLNWTHILVRYELQCRSSARVTGDVSNSR